MKTYVCVVCGHIYEEAAGDPAHGIAPGTLWADVPDDWICEGCAVTKADFVLQDLPWRHAARVMGGVTCGNRAA